MVQVRKCGDIGDGEREPVEEETARSDRVARAGRMNCTVGGRWLAGRSFRRHAVLVGASQRDDRRRGRACVSASQWCRR
jgi:hypothetical protein